ncbi:hypothetical protein H072_6748 [Dactylellina haptotyla CBS 200.50]|uniref:Uncharacterized protein n=1 Tax=Dactylellina haptotyla (strain CBS 200.50) TaxID=1284197 RepID=S8A8Z0_DACHA|nr:hypothetical protein H072_6748 [Dactylellina haptotyla CBS 200.50]
MAGGGTLSLATLPVDILAYLVYDIVTDYDILRALSGTNQTLRHLSQRPTLRETAWLDNEFSDELITWSTRILSQPSLKTLFVDPCGTHIFRSLPDDEHLSRLEDADYIHTQKTQDIYPPTTTGNINKIRIPGLQTFSVQTVANNIYTYNYTHYTPFISSTLSGNINSLTRLWFNGFELVEALQDLPDGGLSAIRLSSLSIRYLPSHEDFVRVFGLRLRLDGVYRGNISGAEGEEEERDAVTGLKYLYLSDGTQPADAELQLLRYMYTPTLKWLHLGGQVFHPQIDPGRLGELLLGYLESFESLEKFGVSRVEEGWKRGYWRVVERVGAQHVRVGGLRVWYSYPGWVGDWCASGCAGQIGEVEMLSILGSLFRNGESNEVNKLSIGDQLWEQEYFSARDVCAIVSTILYVHQRREFPETIEYTDDEEDQISPRVETPSRRRLFDTIKNLQKANYLIRLLRTVFYPQQQYDTARCFLDTLAHTTRDVKKSTWLAKLPDWDTAGKKNRDTVARGFCDAVSSDIPKRLTTLEISLQERIAGKPWPENARDRRFVWNRGQDGWNIAEYK